MLATQSNNVSERNKMQGLVPLSKVARAAIIDTFGDFGKNYELNMHWAARSYHELMMQYLHLKNKLTKRKIVLNVNANTHTATLPCDVENVLFVAGICDGRKIPLPMDGALIDAESVEFEEDRCSDCGQNKNICNELQVTETFNSVVINDITFTETVVKKLYPNGDYYLETTTPYYDLDYEMVEYRTDKKFITNLDIQPCGCLATTAENLTTLQIHCPDTYYCHYASCENNLRSGYGGFNVFEETGLIQLDYSYRYTKVYLEYSSFIKKINGQWYVPQVAFEMLVEMVKFKNIDGKSNVSRFDKDWRQRQIDKARGNLERIIFRFRLSTILELLREPPKFIINTNWYSCYKRNQTLAATTSADTCATTTTTSSSDCCEGANAVITITKEDVFVRKYFIIGASGSPMEDGGDSYILATNSIADKNVKLNSVNVVVNSQTLIENQTDQLSFSVTYTPGMTTVLWTEVLHGDGTSGNSDKVLITYVRTV